MNLLRANVRRLPAKWPGSINVCLKTGLYPQLCWWPLITADF
jgi:hypothetical protein